MSRGLTILELLLCLPLFAILAASFAFTYRSKSRGETARVCAEDQWRWTRALDEIEHKLHRWEILGSECLVNGLNPIQINEKGDVHFLEIESARPIVRQMVTPGLIEIPAENGLSGRQNVLLCGDGAVVSATVLRAHQAAAGGPLPVQLNLDEKDNDRLFNSGTLVAQTAPIEIESVVSEQPPARYLYELRDGVQRPITAGFDSFTFKEDASPVNSEIHYQVNIANGDCRIQRDISLRRSPSVTAQGEWQLMNSGLAFKPWDIQKDLNK